MSKVKETMSDIIIDKAMKYNVISICDYGCGPGELLDLLYEKKPEFQFTGIDYFKKHEIKKSENAQIRFIDREDNEYHQLSENFDMIISTYALHHFQYPVSELKRIYSLLKPGGIMIFFDHQLILDTKPKIVKAYSSLLGEIESTMKKKYHRHHYTIDEASDLLSCLPAEILEVKELVDVLTEKERNEDRDFFLERNRKIQDMIKENASDFWKTIWLPLFELEEQLMTEHNIDYSDYFYILMKK